jgi:hypothetical protein
MIFGTYNKVFRVEEEGATIRGCTRGELLLGKGNKNVSLIATSQLGHAMAIEAHSNYRNSFALRAPRPA